MKNLVTFIIVSLFFVVNLISQNPAYYNYNSLENPNLYPFNVTIGEEIQWLINPHEFSQPTSAPSGYIDTLYFYMNGSSSTHSFWLLTIKLGLTTLTSLPSGTIYVGPLDSVYYRSYVTLNSNAGAWMSIALDHPFEYDTSRSLVIDVYNCGYEGYGMMTVNQHILTGLRRNYINVIGPCTPSYSGQDNKVVHCGVHISPLIGIHHNENNLPVHYSLYQNYPNPFNPNTLIKYSLKENSNVQIIIYNILGQKIKTLVNEFQSAGYKSVLWDGTNEYNIPVSTGLYIYKLVTGSFVDKKKMVLIR